jgi:type VI secretion system protein VasJ
MAEEIAKAQALAKKKKLAEAMEAIHKNIRTSFSRREGLLWRMALSRILVQSRAAGHALPHLEQILQDIESYRLEEWEPELALEGLKMVWSGLHASPDKGVKEKADGALNRIARLDPAEALRLGKKA